MKLMCVCIFVLTVLCLAVDGSYHPLGPSRGQDYLMADKTIYGPDDTINVGNNLPVFPEGYSALHFATKTDTGRGTPGMCEGPARKIASDSIYQEKYGAGVFDELHKSVALIYLMFR
jgi:hypothetical protein